MTVQEEEMNGVYRVYLKSQDEITILREKMEEVGFVGNVIHQEKVISKRYGERLFVKVQITNCDEIKGGYHKRRCMWGYVCRKVSEKRHYNSQYMKVVENRKHIMNPEEFEGVMRQIVEDDYDTEEGHVKMDQIMCDLLKQLGYTEGVKLFESAGKYYA